jgi:uncharacterized protein YbjT (DUF2867 family)
MAQNKIATVFGGTGFVGRQIVRELAKAGYRVKVATRVPERAYFLKPCGTVGQVVPVHCDYDDGESVRAALSGSDVVVNCIGVLFERRKGQRFYGVHETLAALIAEASMQEKVGRLVQISALACERGTSKYAQSKLAGEEAVLGDFPDATILRPSIVFGQDDNFFNMFATIARYSPALPLIGGGETKFQPVYVGDVADAVMAAIKNSAAKGQVYELGGPDVVSFKEVFELIFEHTGRRRCLINLPFGIEKIEATFLSLLPTPLLTRDQVESLKTDNVVNEDALGLEALGVAATSMDIILPTYLHAYREGGRFANLKEA